VDKLKRKLRHEGNVHRCLLLFYQIFRNKVEVAVLEQKRLGIGDGSVGMFSSLIVRTCRHALPFYHLLPIFSHQLAGDAWFLNTPEQSLSFILADQGFDVWVGNVRGTRWSHGHRSYSVKNKELALYDMAEMINYIYSVTNSKLFIVGHSQYHGGTNFDRTAGGPYIATSYDYDAPLDEYGNKAQPKWGHLKELHRVLKSMEESLTNENVSQIDFGNSIT
ncbi:hypothetical protein S245_063206, partial [Arachis hypogaea]